MREMQRGQALLIVLLSMAVVLTIVLSVLSRSVTDIAITSRGEESIRAFSAAEAGIEQVLIGQSTTGTFEGATFDAKVDQIGQGLTSFSYPVEISMGDTANVWFVAHDANDNLVCNAANPCFAGSSFTLCWGANKSYPDPTVMPAVEISVYYLNTPGNMTTARVARAVLDPNAARRALNSFDAPSTAGCTAEGKSFPFSSVVNFGAGGLGIPAAVYNSQNGLQFASVRFLYNSDMAHPFGATSGAIFPNQGKKIESTGKSGDATRKVQVKKLFSDIPPVFMSSIFTPVGITK